MRTRWILAATLSTLLLAGLAAACGDDDDDGDGATPAAATRTVAPGGAATSTVAAGGGAAPTVEVTLKEFEVLPDPVSVAAGEVTFSATNDGPDDVHEFVIVKTDLAPGALPTVADGSVDEEGLDVIDEIEDIAVGSTEELTVDLEAGSYVLLCNIVEEVEGVTEAHYSLGMRAAFTVE